jgi:excisionase family DNA binding protein
MAEPLTTALLDLLAPAIEQLVDEHLDRRLGAFEDAHQPDEWMTSQEAAAYLRVSPPALRARVRRGTVPAHRDGMRLLFSRIQLAATIASPINGASAAATAPPPTPKECTFDAT